MEDQIHTRTYVPDQTQKGLQISLIVPALNEDVLIEQTVRDILDKVKDQFSASELILINDGSTDRTGEIMNQLDHEFPSIRVLHNQRNAGLGACYKQGVEEARFEFVMMLCGDGGLPSESLTPIFETIGTADIVIPYMKNLREIKTPFRYSLSRCYTTLLNSLFNQDLQYYNGLPVHRLALLRQIDIVSSGFGFQGEVLIKLLRAGCSYVQVGVLGAEKTNRSKAVSLKNLINMCRTFLHLIFNLIRFDSSHIRKNQLPPNSDKKA